RAGLFAADGKPCVDPAHRCRRRLPEHGHVPARVPKALRRDTRRVPRALQALSRWPESSAPCPIYPERAGDNALLNSSWSYRETSLAAVLVVFPAVGTATPKPPTNGMQASFQSLGYK